MSELSPQMLALCREEYFAAAPEDRPLITRAAELGAEPITGLGEWRVGKGSIVTDWHKTLGAACREFCEEYDRQQ